MSLYIDLQVNNDPIMSVGVTRTTTDSSGPDAINTYRWGYYRDGSEITGLVEHRYRDGAIGLAAAVLHAIQEAGQ